MKKTGKVMLSSSSEGVIGEVKAWETDSKEPVPSNCTEVSNPEKAKENALDDVDEMDDDFVDENAEDY